MIKTFQSHNASYQKTSEKIISQKKENFSHSSSQNNIRLSNLGNDIFISRSGQVKIDNLDSCRNLGGCDFIVF